MYDITILSPSGEKRGAKVIPGNSPTISCLPVSISKFNSYAIVDDLLATGGTVNCISKILKSVNKKVTGLLVVVELKELGGRLKFKFPVESLILY